MFDVFSASGLEGADDRVLSLLALSLKNSLILGCDSATSSEFRDAIRVTFFFRFTDIFIGLVFFELGKVPKTRLFRQTEGYGLPFLSITTHQHCKRQTYLWSTGLGGAPPIQLQTPTQVPSGTTGTRGFSQADGHEVLCWLD